VAIRNVSFDITLHYQQNVIYVPNLKLVYLSIYKEAKGNARMRVSRNFVNVYTIRYRIYVYTRISLMLSPVAGRPSSVAC